MRAGGGRVAAGFGGALDHEGEQTIIALRVDFPFLLAALLCLLSPLLSAFAKQRLGANQFVAGPQDKSTSVLSSLDWAMDVPQVFAVSLLPVVALIFALPEAPWSSAAAVVAGVVSVVAVVALGIFQPRYATLMLPWIRLTPVALYGLFLNLGIFVILFFNLLPSSNAQIAPASEILRLGPIQQVDPKEATVFTVQLRVIGGPEALAGRTVWIANNTYEESADIYTRPVSFAPAPCEHQAGETWLCRSIYIGQKNDTVKVFAVYPLLVDDRALAAIIDHQVTIAAIKDPRVKGSGAFPAPPGIDSLPSYPYRRPQ